MKIICVLLTLYYVYVSVTGYVSPRRNAQIPQTPGSIVRNTSTITESEAHATTKTEHAPVNDKHSDGLKITTENYTQKAKEKSSEDTSEDSSSDSSVIQSQNLNAENSSSKLTAEGLNSIEKLESLETVERYPQRRHPIGTETFLSQQDEINYTPTPNLGKRFSTLKIAFGSVTPVNKKEEYLLVNHTDKTNNITVHHDKQENIKIQIINNVSHPVVYSKNTTNQGVSTIPDDDETNEYIKRSRKLKEKTNHSQNSSRINTVAVEHCCHDQDDEAVTAKETENPYRILGLPYVEPIGVKFNLTSPSLRNLTSIKVFLHQINEFIGFEGKFYVCAVLVYCFIVSALTMFLSERSPYS